MMSREGQGRGTITRSVVVLTLACVAGMVNATGFFAVGTYTSHVTGHASMVGDELARGNIDAAVHFSLLVLFFIAGAFSGTLLVEKARRFGTARYAAALLVEAGILMGFTVMSALVPEKGSGFTLLLTAMLSVAMGMQNALVTQISGAVVRTTHLTGVATDIGIELARLGFWLREHARITAPIQLIVDFAREEELEKLRVHLSLFASFMGGACVGPLLYLKHGHGAMLAPGGMILGLVAFDRIVWQRLAKGRRAEERLPDPVEKTG